jgi:hypothetical protein
MMYDPNAGDDRFAFIQNARRQGVNRLFGITGMTNRVAIQVYVVWNQGSNEVLSPVRSDEEFNRCVELMSMRDWRDRFQFVYADGSANANGSGPLAILLVLATALVLVMLLVLGYW